MRRKTIPLTALALVLAAALAAAAFGTRAETAASHLLYAVRVNAYGTNLHDPDVSTVCHDLPLRVSQTGNGLRVSGEINGEPVEVALTVRGKNQAESFLYFDTVSCSEGFSVLTAMYFDSFSEAVPLFKEQAAGSRTLLKLYLKDLRAERAYALIEVPGFVLDRFSQLVDQVPVAASDYWYAREFLPVDVTVSSPETSPVEIAPHAAAMAETTWSVTQFYTTPEGLEFQERADLCLGHDVLNIRADSDATWKHTIKIDSKTSICTTDPAFNEYGTSCIQILNPRLTAITPKNCAFFTTQFDGVVTKKASVSDFISLGFGVSAPGASLSLSPSGLLSGGTYDLDETFPSYPNSELKNSYARTMRATLSDMGTRCLLQEEGDCFIVYNTIRDYGGVPTAQETLSADWTFDVRNSVCDGSSTYSKTASFTCHVI